VDSADINKGIQEIIKHHRIVKLLALPPEVVVRHGEHRLSLCYEVINIEYNVNNNRIEIVTGEQK
jgi:hypothetical protein